MALSGATNNYTDIAGDFQIQFIGEKNTATLKGTYVRENQSLNATGPAGLGTTNASDWLSYLSTDFTYWYKRRYGFTGGYLSTMDRRTNSRTTGVLVLAPMTVVQAGGPYTSPSNPLLAVGVTNSANGDPATNAWVG